ncbi:MAG: hypothetical protein JWN86_2038 [Planctomycetota bacterium]|nr:hypothetical protein [Planctomycetota bacterium]
MTLRSRIGGLLLGLSLVGAIGIFPSLAQDPAKDTGAPAKKEKGSTGTKASRRVPANFSKVGLTDEQREKIYEIRAKHQDEISSLKAKIDDLQAKELAECESVLLDSQKKVLADLRATSKQSKKAGAAEKEKGKSQD